MYSELHEYNVNETIDDLRSFLNETVELQRTKYIQRDEFIDWIRKLESIFKAKRKENRWDIFVFPSYAMLNYIASYDDPDTAFENDIKNILEKGFENSEIEKLRELYRKAKALAGRIKCIEYGQNCAYITIDGNYAYLYTNAHVIQKLRPYLATDQFDGGFTINLRKYDSRSQEYYTVTYERYSIPNNFTIKIMRGTLPRLLKILEKLNINHNGNNLFFTKNVSIDRVPENLLKILRDYQIRSVNKAIDSIKKYGVATIMAATGSGKTEIGIALAKALSPTPDSPVLIIAPTKDLVVQWYQRLMKYGINDVGIITGDYFIAPSNASIFISTPDMPYLSVKNLDKNAFNTVFSHLVSKEPNLYDTIFDEIKMIEEIERGTSEDEEETEEESDTGPNTDSSALLLDERKTKMLEILKKAKGIIFDEAHHLPARKVNLTARVTPQAVRIGLSATPWRNDKLDLIIYESAGEIVDRVTSSELIEKKYLVPAVIIRFHTTVHELDKVKRSGEPYYYQKEKKLVLFNDDRLRLTAEISKIVPYPVLILTGELKPGEKLLEKMLEQGLDASIIHGRLSTEERKHILALFNHTANLITKLHEVARKNNYELDNERLTNLLNEYKKKTGIPVITHLIGTTLADEGLDVPALRSLILYFPGKSSTRVFQRIGRSLRPSPEKHFATVIDIVDDNSKYFNRHAIERLKLYREENRWKVIDVKSLDELSNEIKDLSKKTRDELIREIELENELKKKLLDENWKEVEPDEPLIIITPSDPPDLRRPIMYKHEQDENYEIHKFKSIKSGDQVVIYKKKNKIKQSF